ncbi:hypothetical protein [Nocardioides luti]|uniref:hypothetical protein n=1 Tax=Nocardioides luti TaxID=2761101 RepID=UPI001C8AB211|nr:hypothetical protein [Nocardioides luti]
MRVWHAGDGWGVLDSDATPGGCWAHYSSVLVPGYRSLSAGQAVGFTFEAPGQDGFDFRAVEVWPLDSGRGEAVVEAAGPGGAAYSSTLDLSFEDGSSGGPELRA